MEEKKKKKKKSIEKKILTTFKGGVPCSSYSCGGTNRSGCNFAFSLQGLLLILDFCVIHEVGVQTVFSAQ